jgi:transcriptional regulator with XRE-family HTH domain
MSLCISDNLKILRNKHGYTMESLAEIIGVSRQTIAKWEAGESYPDIENCAKLSQLYKVLLDALINKPLWQGEVDDLVGSEKKVCGVLEISEGGGVMLPEMVMDMFGFEPGEKVLLLADRDQGIAIVKCQF